MRRRDNVYAVLVVLSIVLLLGYIYYLAAPNSPGDYSTTTHDYHNGAIYGDWFSASMPVLWR